MSQSSRNFFRDKALLVDLSIKQFSARKTDKRATTQFLSDHGASEGSANVSKRLLPEEALEAIKTISGEARLYYYQQTLPWSDKGSRLLPSANFDACTAQLAEFKARFDDAVAQFIDGWEGYVETARQQLNGLFNSDDYPTLSVVKKKFNFSVDFYPVPTADDFRFSVPEAAVAALERSLDRRLDEAKASARIDLYRRLAERLQRIVERMTADKVIVKDSLIDGLRELLALIPALNVTGDPQLDAIREEVTKRIGCYSAGALRNHVAARNETLTAAKDILAKMDAYTGGQATANIDEVA